MSLACLISLALEQESVDAKSPWAGWEPGAFVRFRTRHEWDTGVVTETESTLTLGENVATTEGFDWKYAACETVRVGDEAYSCVVRRGVWMGGRDETRIQWRFGDLPVPLREMVYSGGAVMEVRVVTRIDEDRLLVGSRLVKGLRIRGEGWPVLRHHRNWTEWWSDEVPGGLVKRREATRVGDRSWRIVTTVEEFGGRR